MHKGQLTEGRLASCRRAKCLECCCDDGTEEWIVEFFAFHGRMKDHLRSLDIEIEFHNDRVRFKGCSDGESCKFLKHSLNKGIDPRPIDCKIFPFVVDWDTIDFDKRVVRLYLWDRSCPLVRKNLIDRDFRRDVEAIIKRDFSLLFYGAGFSVEFVEREFRG
jgi:Fe-S-cluster containining protein